LKTYFDITGWLKLFFANPKETIYKNPHIESPIKSLKNWTLGFITVETVINAIAAQRKKTSYGTSDFHSLFLANNTSANTCGIFMTQKRVRLVNDNVSKNNLNIISLSLK
tara:strand:+ start:648 stop:977 length:330 start_codon:yes stop_codon:yes gene_type:complete